MGQQWEGGAEIVERRKDSDSTLTQPLQFRSKGVGVAFDGVSEKLEDLLSFRRILGFAFAILSSAADGGRPNTTLRSRGRCRRTYRPTLELNKLAME